MTQLYILQYCRMYLYLFSTFVTQSDLKVSEKKYSSFSMLKSIRHDPARFELQSEQIKPFEKLIINLENIIFDGCIFKVYHVNLC